MYQKVIDRLDLILSPLLMVHATDHIFVFILQMGSCLTRLEDAVLCCITRAEGGGESQHRTPNLRTIWISFSTYSYIAGQKGVHWHKAGWLYRELHLLQHHKQYELKGTVEFIQLKIVRGRKVKSLGIHGSTTLLKGPLSAWISSVTKIVPAGIHISLEMLCTYCLFKIHV